MSIPIERLNELYSNEKNRSNELLRETISEEGRLATDLSLTIDLSKSTARLDLLKDLMHEANLSVSIPSETKRHGPPPPPQKRNPNRDIRKG